MQRSRNKWTCCRLEGVKRTWAHPKTLQETINVLHLRMTIKEWIHDSENMSSLIGINKLVVL